MTTKLRVAAGLTIALSVIGPSTAKPAPTDSVYRLNYAWWQKASSDARAASVRSAILASMTGWEHGFAIAQSAGSDSVAARSGRVYPRSLSYYVRAINEIYIRHARARMFEVPDILYSCLQARFSSADCNRIIKRDDRFDDVIMQRGKARFVREPTQSER